MHATNKPIPNPRVVFREEFDDWAILFDPETGKAFGVNPIGAGIWNKLDGKRDPKEIVWHIQKHFDNVPSDVETRVGTFIEYLAKNGLSGCGWKLNENVNENSKICGYRDYQ